ncbi:aldo/keto reductase [Anaerofustis stercorihominis]|uniref:aldo/keto reductase n=1 Tax=Anaerofustis stercorihominis TaxID=214853 RepID=UPI00210BF483|nr:aldo/keto reductase [Anaerofustis stercorihominis]MCQ4795041.1 aldo/keto reductase [Anaerofustis stercorihominis]
MKSLKDTFKLNNGYEIPCIGYGTFQTPDGDSVVNGVKEAIKAGYRHIDTAWFYQNEKGVGQGIRESGVKREDLFITSKLWNSDRGYESAKEAFEKTMDNLGLEYLDLYLIHWPANKKQFDNAEEINANTWRAFEDIYETGRVKSIGLSNFLPQHIDELMKTAKIKPMVNQIEFHPGFAQIETAEYCIKNDIVAEAWSPLGRKDALSNETLIELSKKYDKSVAQICIRWVLQHNILPLPKSVTPSRIIENADVFDFEIDNEDIKIIDDIPYCGGQCADPDEVDF